MEVNKKQKVDILNYQAEHTSPLKIVSRKYLTVAEESMIWTARMNAFSQALPPKYVYNPNNT